jgi:Helix-turn-helix domain
MANDTTKNGVLPFETELGFTAIPNAIYMYYVKHPKFNPSTERLYCYLLRRYNADYGYAFPSWNAIIRETGLSRFTVKKCLDNLEYLGLINRIDHDNGGEHANKIYTFNKPIEDEEEFYRVFGADLKSGEATGKGGKGKTQKTDSLHEIDESYF